MCVCVCVSAAKVYKITQGTIDIGEADVEWVARPYMNTSHKRDFL